MNVQLTPDIIHGTALDYLRHASVSKWALTTYLACRFHPAAAQPSHEIRRAIETELERMCEQGRAKKVKSARGAVCYLQLSNPAASHDLSKFVTRCLDYAALEEKYRESLREQNVLRAQLHQARTNNQRLSSLAMQLAQRIETRAATEMETLRKTEKTIDHLTVHEPMEQNQ